jgi:hypothetical protein
LGRGVSSRQSCESCEVEVLVPPIACSRADSISDACEGNDARSARMKKPRLPCEFTGSGRSDLGGKQTVRPEHKEIAATSITSPRQIAFAERSEKPTKPPSWGRRHWGRTREKHSIGLAGVRAQASQDGFAEITSGRTRWQQGLGATCKDSLNEVNNQSRGGPNGFDEWVGKSDDRGVMSLQETIHVSLMKVTPTSGKAALGTWWFLRQTRGRLDKTGHTKP